MILKLGRCPSLPCRNLGEGRTPNAKVIAMIGREDLLLITIDNSFYTIHHPCLPEIQQKAKMLFHQHEVSLELPSEQAVLLLRRLQLDDNLIIYN